MLQLALGVVCVWSGVSFINDPTWTTKYGLELDVSDYNILLAVITAGIGVYTIWTTVSDGLAVNNIDLICPKCETAVDFREVGDHTCPKCGTQLEPLDGFYDRHPELKDE